MQTGVLVAAHQRHQEDEPTPAIPEPAHPLKTRMAIGFAGFFVSGEGIQELDDIRQEVLVTGWVF